MNEPQVWTLIGVFAAGLFGMLTLMSTMFIRIVRTEIGSVRSELGLVHTHLSAEIASVRTELRTEIASVRTELSSEIRRVEEVLSTRLGHLERDAVG